MAELLSMHVSGTGPLYIRALKRIDDDSDEVL